MLGASEGTFSCANATATERSIDFIDLYWAMTSPLITGQSVFSVYQLITCKQSKFKRKTLPENAPKWTLLWSLLMCKPLPPLCVGMIWSLRSYLNTRLFSENAVFALNCQKVYVWATVKLMRYSGVIKRVLDIPHGLWQSSGLINGWEKEDTLQVVWFRSVRPWSKDFFFF